MTPSVHGKIILIAGPTASGKSALAVDVACAFNGVVINADSMQVYRDLPLLSSGPTPAEMARAPHRLYGVLDGAETCSAARWLEMATTEITAAWAEGRQPVVVGGTGLYLRALMEGLSPVPTIPPAVRAATRARFADMGNAAFHSALAEFDPDMAARLRPTDSQRLIRAWEAREATGQSLAHWQDEATRPPLNADILPVILLPPRECLHARSAERFDQMLAEGALEEVRALAARHLDPALPVMKALGVSELLAHLSGAMSLEDARTKAKAATRQYIKRQTTWLRNQMGISDSFTAQYSESLRERIFAKIRQFLLTAPN